MLPDLPSLLGLLSLPLMLGACTPWVCSLEEGSDPDFASDIGCWADFDLLSSEPLDSSIPGARSGKTVVDRIDTNSLYFQNSKRYSIHWDFASTHLSGKGLPVVPDLGAFNATEYASPDRRFVLGAVTYYEEPDVWAYEIAPYDTASSEMMELAFDSIREHSYFGKDLYLHPTSENVAANATDLPKDIPIITTDELFAGITYQPLNPAVAMGKLTFYTDTELEASHPDFREIVVLQTVPNDIDLVLGIITSQFQTPLAHINVLSQNRGTPNMGLVGAFSNTELRDLQDKWVELTVGLFDWSVREVTQAEADAWWEEHKPEPLLAPPMNLDITGLWDERGILGPYRDLQEAIHWSVRAFGGKASHFGAMTRVQGLPHPHAFAIPVYYYNQHMVQNGLWAEVEALLDDPVVRADASLRSEALAQIRLDIRDAPVNKLFWNLVTDKLNTDYPGIRMRFRSSTNAEDLSGFNGAGLYTSKSGDPNDPTRPIARAIRKVWASVWSDRAFAEREYYGIDHRNIGMALLVHRSFPDEDANGVAITANIFDPAGLEPAFYVNTQKGDVSVVLPDPSIKTDQFLYYFDRVGQPVVYLGHSNLVPEGETVLNTDQIHQLGQAMDAIHTYFLAAYGDRDYYAMDIEFKFDSMLTKQSRLYVKQARPYPGRGVGR